MMTKRNVLLILIVFAFCSCTGKKEFLVGSFRDFHAREVPVDIFRLDKLNEFDLLLQKQETIGERYNYPNTFVMGLYNDNSHKYDRSHVIVGFSPAENYEFLKTVSDYYSTDTTYLDNIQFTDTINIDNEDVRSLKDTLYRISINERQSTYKLDSKKYIVLIYRKTDPAKDAMQGNRAMWKRSFVSLTNGKLKTEHIETMNEHLF